MSLFLLSSLIRWVDIIESAVLVLEQRLPRGKSGAAFKLARLLLFLSYPPTESNKVQSLLLLLVVQSLINHKL